MTNQITIFQVPSTYNLICLIVIPALKKTYSSDSSIVGDVYHLMKSQANHLDNIGREFEVPHQFRSSLKAVDSSETKLEQVLMKWLTSECSEVSWSTVTKVLKSLEYINLVRKLADDAELLKKVQSH